MNPFADLTPLWVVGFCVSAGVMAATFYWAMFQAERADRWRK